MPFEARLPFISVAAASKTGRFDDPHDETLDQRGPCCVRKAVIPIEQAEPGGEIVRRAFIQVYLGQEYQPSGDYQFAPGFCDTYFELETTRWITDRSKGVKLSYRLQNGRTEVVHNGRVHPHMGINQAETVITREQISPAWIPLAKSATGVLLADKFRRT